ncbi:MAG TPA: ATP-binding protein [Thermoanaerobaculia bacterium]|jgi:signal transduction histidine kinase
MKTHSLRHRLILGAVIWMFGLLLVMNVVVNVVFHYFPDYASRRLTHYSAMGFVAASFVVGGITMVMRGLRPLEELRAKLGRVRGGDARALDGDYPAEVQPLVDDLNALLVDREEAIARALRTAGDLAHGLKTPLAILAHEAERAQRAGHDELAATIEQQVERMRRQVEYQLARARATASAGGAAGMRCTVAPSVEGLMRTMFRLHASRGLSIVADVAPHLAIRGSREDLDEMLGNLLDNACKWARSRVSISAALDGERAIVTVDDDGPGLDPSMRDAVLQRGVRADEAAPGSGLGLAIVRDLAELYGGGITLASSPEGGMRARLELVASP